MNLTDKCRHGEELRYVCKLCEGDIAAFEAALAESKKDCADAEAEWARVDEEAKSLRARVSDLETALATLLDAAERQAAGFPLQAEQWFAVRDYAMARLPEKRTAGAEEVECE